MGIDFEKGSRVILEEKKEFLENKTDLTNYLNGAIWAPDGSSVLTASADKRFRVFKFPEEEKKCLKIKEGEQIFDYCWYPYAVLDNPQTYCFLSTARGHPIHLWDARSGDLRATYRCYNLQDEILSCTSVQFSADGIVYGGSKNSIFIFDIGRPGRDYLHVKTFEKDRGGLRGIISAMAFSRADPKIYAVGAYSAQLGIFSTETNTLVLPLSGHQGGVTKIIFSGDGNFVYSGARCDTSLFCWDIRMTGQAVYKFQRDTPTTNQRIHFDIDPMSGQYLASGGENGALVVYDLLTGEQSSLIQVSKDTLNGVSFHPYLPYIATSTGRRHFPKMETIEQDIDATFRILQFAETKPDERNQIESGDVL